MTRGEIWMVKLPQSSGREQFGTRPALVVADTKTSIAVAIPLTSQLRALNLPHTHLIKASVRNGLAVDSVALTLQIRALDKQRFVKKTGRLEPTKMRQVDQSMRGLLGL